MKWILLLLLVVGGGAAYWMWTSAGPHAAACARFAEVCGADKRKTCDDALDGFAKVSSREEVASTEACIRAAQSCAEAAGCLAGGGAKAGWNAAGQFLKGLGESLGK